MRRLFAWSLLSGFLAAACAKPEQPAHYRQVPLDCAHLAFARPDACFGGDVGFYAYERVDPAPGSDGGFGFGRVADFVATSEERFVSDGGRNAAVWSDDAGNVVAVDLPSFVIAQNSVGAHIFAERHAAGYGCVFGDPNFTDFGPANVEETLRLDGKLAYAFEEAALAGSGLDAGNTGLFGGLSWRPSTCEPDAGTLAAVVLPTDAGTVTVEQGKAVDAIVDGERGCLFVASSYLPAPGAPSCGRARFAFISANAMDSLVVDDSGR